MSSDEVKEVKVVEKLAVALEGIALGGAVVTPAVEVVVVTAAAAEEPKPAAGKAMGGAGGGGGGGGGGNSSSSGGESSASSAAPLKQPSIDMRNVIAMYYITKGGNEPCTVYCENGTSDRPCSMVNITYIFYIMKDGTVLVKWAGMLSCPGAIAANAAWTEGKKALVEGKSEDQHPALLADYPDKPHPVPAPRITDVGSVPHIESGKSSKSSLRIVGAAFGAPDNCSLDFITMIRGAQDAVRSGVPAPEAMALIFAIIEANREGDLRFLEIIGASERMKAEYVKAKALVLAKDAATKATKAKSPCKPYPSGCLTCECPRCYGFYLTRSKVVANMVESLKKDPEFVAFRSAFDKANATAPLLGF